MTTTVRTSLTLSLLLFIQTVSLWSQSIFDDLEFISPSPTASHIVTVKYLNGRFVAVGGQGTLISSPDGTNWTRHSTGYTGSLGDVDYGNGVYIVTTAGSGPIYISADLETWEQTGSNLLPGNNDNVYFDDGLFYFGGWQGEIFTSADGKTFAELSTGGMNTVRDIVYSGSLFVAVSEDLEILTSPDGASWSTVSGLPEKTGLQRGLIGSFYLNSKYIVTGKSGTLFSSDDAITWTEHTPPEESAWMFDLYFDGTDYYSAGSRGKLFKSSDLDTWTEVNMNLPTVYDTVYGMASDGSTIVVIGRSAMLVSTTDLVTFTNRRGGYEDGVVSTAYGANRFVALLGDGMVLGSSDGETWSEMFDQTSVLNWQKVIFKDGKFVALGSKGEISQSADGITWSIPTGELEDFRRTYDIKYFNNKWYVCGSQGTIRSSSNLSSWTLHDQAISTSFKEMDYGNSVFVVVGDSGEIYSSTNGSDWTASSSGGSANFASLAFGAGTFLATATNSVLTSSDGVNWSAENQSNQPFSGRGNAYVEGLFISLDTGGRVKTSSDGFNWNTTTLPINGSMLSVLLTDSKIVITGTNGLLLSGDLPAKLTLDVATTGDGDVVVTPDLPSYLLGTDVTLSATGSLDYAFSSWSGDASGNSNPLIVSMDGDKTITANFVISVSGFRLWVLSEFNESERNNESLSGPLVDFDNDGRVNLLEYVAGSAPKEKDFDPFFQVDLLEDGGDEYLLLSYTSDKSVSGITQRAEFSTDMQNWSYNGDGSGQSYTATYDTMDNGDGTETIFIQLISPKGSADKQFMRLNFSQ